MISNSAVTQQSTGSIGQKGEEHMSSSKTKFGIEELTNAIRPILNSIDCAEVSPGGQLLISLPQRLNSPATILPFFRGSLDRKNKDNRVSEFTLYDSASITKFVVALLVHRLIHQGKVSLKSKVGDFLTASECSEELRMVTLVELLSHQLVFNLPEWIKETSGRDTIAAILKAIFRKGFRYGNFCTVVTGEVLKKVTGKDLPHLFNELTMNRPNIAEGMWFTEVGPCERKLIAPTSNDELAGIVHDPLTRQIASLPQGATCGTAGLFANASIESVNFKDNQFSESEQARIKAEYPNILFEF